MKPSLTVDERGLILHVTTEDGEGVAVPLNAQTVGEAVKAAERVLTPEGKRRLVRGFARLLLEVIGDENQGGNDDGKKV